MAATHSDRQRRTHVLAMTLKELSGFCLIVDCQTLAAEADVQAVSVAMIGRKPT